MTEILPKKGERNILVTSALPYVNNVPHLGNIIGSLLSADVYARYCRQKGHNTIYICGTDEYGTATEVKALQEGLTPKEICDKYFKIHKSVYEWFNLKFDYFGRTSTDLQTAIAQDIFLKLHKNGLTKEEVLKQLYCETCKMFLADRFVHGICPKCGYKDARGDQCDKCGELLSPETLIEPKCSICSKTPIEKSTEHLFLDLPSLSKKLEEWKTESYKSECWSTIAMSITDSWLKEGLKPRCITRDLKWGTPVPLEKYKDKVFYVWFDAPIGYISITANYTKKWEEWWKNPDIVENVEFMGKDNVPFHSVIFPGTLIGTNEKYSLVNKLSATEYLNYEDGKFSKSRNTGVFGDSVQELGIDADVFRYYLLTNRPETADSIFSWDDFLQKNNNELLSNLGNFVNRPLKFCENSFQGKVPALELNDQDKKVISEINLLITDYIKAMEKIKLKEGLHISMKISSLGNLYLQEQQPWEVYKKDQKRCGSIINLSLHIAYCLACLLEPYIPSFTKTVAGNQLKLQGENLKIHDQLQLNILKEGHQIGKIDPIFKKLDPKQIQLYKEKFGGAKDHFLLDLRVGQIKSVTEIEGSDKLFKLKVDVGEKTQRTVVAGLKGVYKSEELIERKVIVVCNLVHSKLKGETSEGMLLVAGKEKVTLLLPPKDSKCGDLALPLKYESKPETGLKKNALTKLLVHFKVGKNSSCLFKDVPLCVNKEEVLAVGAEEGSEVK